MLLYSVFIRQNRKYDSILPDFVINPIYSDIKNGINNYVKININIKLNFKLT